MADSLSTISDNLTHMCSWAMEQLQAAHKEYHDIVDNPSLSVDDREALHEDVHEVLLSIYKLIKPVLDYLKETFPLLWHIVEWAIGIIKTLHHLFDELEIECNCTACAK